MATTHTLSYDPTNKKRSESVTQTALAKTYNFNTKGKYNDSDIALTVNIDLSALTSDATAGNTEVLEKKTFYNNGMLLEGKMPIINNISINASSVDVGSTTTSASSSALSYSLMSLINNVLTNIDSYIYSAFNKGSTSITFSISNSDLANSIGLTAEKILKGNSILGIEGTATKYTNPGAILVKASPNLSERYNFIFCNGKLYASPVSSDKTKTTYYSSDGKTWIDSEIPRINSVQYNANFPDCSYIAGGIGNKYIYYSNDGYSWTSLEIADTGTSSIYDCTNAVTFFNNFYIIAGKYYNGSVYYGLYYMYRIGNDAIVISTFRKKECYFLETINNYLITITSDDDAYYSSNGTKWSVATVDNSSALGFTKVTKIGNALYGIKNGYLTKTTTGTSWTSTPTNVDIHIYEYAHNVFVGSGISPEDADYYPIRYNMYYSSDGITWTLANIDKPANGLHVNKIVYNEYKEIWWASCDNALYWSIDDGKSWNMMTDSKSKSLIYIGYVNNIVVASGTSNEYTGIYYIDDENYNYSD